LPPAFDPLGVWSRGKEGSLVYSGGYLLARVGFSVGVRKSIPQIETMVIDLDPEVAIPIEDLDELEDIKLDPNQFVVDNEVLVRNDHRELCEMLLVLLEKEGEVLSA
jgi:hypothetical protein